MIAAFAARDRTWWNVVGRGMAEKGYGLFFGKKKLRSVYFYQRRAVCYFLRGVRSFPPPRENWTWEFPLPPTCTTTPLTGRAALSIPYPPRFRILRRCETGRPPLSFCSSPEGAPRPAAFAPRRCWRSRPALSISLLRSRCFMSCICTTQTDQHQQ